MNIIGKGKNKKKEGKEAKAQTWKQMKEEADKEEVGLRNELESLKTWVDMMQTMNNEQMKEYLKNRPDDLKIKVKPSQKSQKNQTSQKNQKGKTKVQGNGKAKSSAYSGIMASVLKFHKDD